MLKHNEAATGILKRATGFIENSSWFIIKLIVLGDQLACAGHWLIRGNATDIVKVERFVTHKMRKRDLIGPFWMFRVE